MNKNQLDAAWSTMQDRLKLEPESEKWTMFVKQMKQEPEALTERREEINPAQLTSPSAQTNQSSAPTAPPNPSTWLKRHKRWIAGAAAACVLGWMLATPAGNQVLASLQHQFRMEQVTAVEEQSLKELFNTMGLSESTINRYGEFSHATEGEFATYETLEELQGQYDRELKIPELFLDRDPQQLRIEASPSRTFTMKVNAEEINATMRKLGADTLLPLSIDGKLLTLTMGSAVQIALLHDDSQPPYSFTQRPVPSVTIEDGVPMAEALEAVLQFPLIPAQLKQELTQSQVLGSGSAPLPVVVPEGFEQLQVANIKVLWKGDATEGRYSAVWTHEGQLFTFSGAFPDRDAFTTLLEELIHS